MWAYAVRRGVPETKEHLGGRRGRAPHAPAALSRWPSPHTRQARQGAGWGLGLPGCESPSMQLTLPRLLQVQELGVPRRDCSRNGKNVQRHFWHFKGHRLAPSGCGLKTTACPLPRFQGRACSGPRRPARALPAGFDPERPPFPAWDGKLETRSLRSAMQGLRGRHPGGCAPQGRRRPPNRTRAQSGWRGPGRGSYRPKGDNGPSAHASGRVQGRAAASSVPTSPS